MFSKPCHAIVKVITCFQFLLLQQRGPFLNSDFAFFERIDRYAGAKQLFQMTSEMDSMPDLIVDLNSSSERMRTDHVNAVRGTYFPRWLRYHGSRDQPCPIRFHKIDK